MAGIVLATLLIVPFTPGWGSQDRHASVYSKAVIDFYLDHMPLTPLPVDQTLADGRREATYALDGIQMFLGPVVGYKAGLTSAAAQTRFGIGHPLRGTLLRDMLVHVPGPGETVWVPQSFGLGQGLNAQQIAELGPPVPGDADRVIFHREYARYPAVEADLMVRVDNTAINTATTPMELLAALDAVMPFVELPDLAFAPGTALTAAAIVAINVGARRGVVGHAVPLAATASWLKRLGNIRAEITGPDGKPIAKGTAHGLLGHPLHAVAWLRDSLRADGILLREGDLLSLGTMTPPIAPPERLRVRYWGLLDGGEPIDLRLRFAGSSATHSALRNTE